MPEQAPYNESLLFSTFSIKLIDGKTHLRSLDKEDFHIHLKAEASRNLTITVTEKRKKRFDLLLRDNATFHSIFYDEESRAYLLEVGISYGYHPIGPFSPGILRRLN